jgi:hypothetical protein
MAYHCCMRPDTACRVGAAMQVNNCFTRLCVGGRQPITGYAVYKSLLNGNRAGFRISIAQLIEPCPSVCCFFHFLIFNNTKMVLAQVNYS